MIIMKKTNRTKEKKRQVGVSFCLSFDIFFIVSLQTQQYLTTFNPQPPSYDDGRRLRSQVKVTDRVNPCRATCQPGGKQESKTDEGRT